MSRPLWWRCKLQLIRPRRPGHCLGPAWWAPSVQEGGGRQGVAAAAAAATATATAAAAAAAAAVVLMVGSGSSCSSGSLSRSDSSLSRGASSSSSSSSIRRRVSPVTAGLLSCTFSRVQRRRLAFFGTAPVPAAGPCEQACMALSLATAGLVRELAAVNTCTHAASLGACEQAACVHCTRCWVFSHSHAFSFPHSLLEEGLREW